MRFEEREPKPYSEPVRTDELKEGLVYFAVNFVDDEMLVPLMQPRVFIGKDLDSNEKGFFFQDVDSYRRGVRFQSATEADDAVFEVGPPPNHIFEFERALDVLMQCALRRRKRPIDG